MPMLGDHEGADWLEPGDHLVTVIEGRMFRYKSESQGVEFLLRDNFGKTLKTSFCLVETILWRLCSFAKACGLSKDDLKAYDTDNPRSHALLVGREVMVRVTRPEKYCEVESWWPVDGEAPEAQKPTPTPPPGETSKPEEDIPF